MRSRPAACSSFQSFWSTSSTAWRSCSPDALASVGAQTVHVVEHVEETTHQGRLGAVAELGALARDALPVVVVLGGEAEMPIARLLELVLEAADGLLRRLRREADAWSELRLRRIGATGGRFLGHIGGCHVGAVGALPPLAGIGHAARGVHALDVVRVFAAKSSGVSHL